MLPGFAPVIEKGIVPAQCRAEYPGPAGDRVTEGLIQCLPAAVAFLSQEQTQHTYGGKFGGIELHSPPPFGSSSPGSESVSGGFWLRGGCGFCRTCPHFAELS